MSNALELIRATEVVTTVACQSPGDRGKVIVGIRVDPKKLNFIGVLEAMNDVLSKAEAAFVADESGKA